MLFEHAEGAGSIGHSDTYLLVHVPDEGLRGQTREVRITGVNGETLEGSVGQ